MSTDVADRLRGLSHDYQAGRLNRDAYRKLRAPLIDALANPHASHVTSEVTQPRSIGRVAASPPPAVAPVAAAAPVERASAAETSAKPRLVLVICGVALIAASAIWLLWPSDAIEKTPSSNAGALREPANPVHEAIERFSARGDWSEAQLVELNAVLLELGQERIAAAAADPSFNRFVERLRGRLKEHQALAAEPLRPHSSPIAALAVTVGLDLDAPDAAIRIAPRVTSVPVEPKQAAGREKFVAATPAPLTPHTATSKSKGPARDEKDTASPATQPTAESVAEPESKAQPRENACRLELIESRRPFCHDTLASGEAGPSLALIPSGAFDLQEAASSRHIVIAKPFALSVHEVSQAEFRLYCRSAGVTCPAQPEADDELPIVNVTWQDAHAYTQWLSRATGRRYGLPTEAQWEYAARAGRDALVADTPPALTDVHYSMLKAQAAPARRSQRFNPNAFRLLHTLGNVREWVEQAPDDPFAAPDGMRVARGGSYVDNATQLRLSTREVLAEGTRDMLTGFRVMREVP